MRLSNNRYKNAFARLDKLVKKFGDKLGDIEIKSVQDEIWYQKGISFEGKGRETIRELGIKRILVYNSLEDKVD